MTEGNDLVMSDNHRRIVLRRLARPGRSGSTCLLLMYGHKGDGLTGSDMSRISGFSLGAIRNVMGMAQAVGLVELSGRGGLEGRAAVGAPFRYRLTEAGEQFCASHAWGQLP